MRVVAFNISSCRAGLDRVIDALGELDPDVVVLNEVARGQDRAIGRAIGRVSVKGNTLRLRGFGNAVLLRERPSSVRRLRLRRTRRRERRGALIVRLPAGATVAATHLGLGDEERVRHARQILRALEGVVPLIVAGDLNETTGGAAVGLLCAELTDAFAVAREGSGSTYPADVPAERLDYVLCSPDVRVVRTFVDDRVASDHRAVVADLVLPGVER